MNYLLPKINDLQGYTPGKQPGTDDWIKLNTNESAFPPSPKIFEYLNSFKTNSLLTKYPSIESQPVKKTIANLHEVLPQQIIIGNGSDEILRLIIHATSDASHPITVSEVTYSLYETIAQSYDVPIQKVSVKSSSKLETSLEGLEKTSSNIIFLPNPNAQTGEFITPKELAFHISKSNKLWVIDEAYNDFVEGSEETSSIDIAKKYNNIIVTRTLSKSYSLAGIRFGYAYSSNQNLIEGLYKIRDSYNQDSLTLQLANLALQEQGYYKKCILETIQQRKFLNENLTKIGFTVLKSQGNFILVKPPQIIKMQYLLEHLNRNKILVRHFVSHPILNKYVRISVGSKNQNNTLLSSIRVIIPSS